MFGKEINSATTRRFTYNVLGKNYIIDVEEIKSDYDGKALYEYSILKENETIRWTFHWVKPDQTQAKDPKFYSFEECMEMMEDNLLRELARYEEMLRVLDVYFWNED